MAIEKPLKVRDYLEPRSAAAAGPRSTGAARKNLASFQDLLKNEKLASAEGVAAGMRISQYLKSPVLRTQAPRTSSMPGVSSSTSVGPRAAESVEQARIDKTLQPGESGQASKPQIDLRTRRFQRSPAYESRADASSSQPVEKSIQQAAAKYNLAPELIRSVIRAESNFQPSAVSPAGAKGLMQLMPETARELGVKNVFDIHQNIDGGARYLRQMLDRFGGDVKRALAAYNAGPGAVDQHNGDVPYAETRQYVKRVMRSAGLG
jgi:soluble lytic murein transglycosylase-like protein